MALVVLTDICESGEGLGFIMYVALVDMVMHGLTLSPTFGFG